MNAKVSQSHGSAKPNKEVAATIESLFVRVSHENRYLNPVFLDEAVIFVKSGRGGNGAATFRKEKHVPRGGPNGGDGGRGGDVIFVADPNLNTLIEFHYKTHFEAENGEDGGSDNKDGRDGKSVILKVPLGTIIKDKNTGEVLVDLTSPGQTFCAVKGGRGGRGNKHFVTSVRQAPTFAEKGEPAKERVLLVEVKLLADVGLVGLPNAGKSTLIRSVSAAKPKVADYPFTTLVPTLGIVRVGEESFVMADLPGLIEGASVGKGLGDRFLRHIERTRVIVHVVECHPMDGSDPLDNYKTVLKELENYSRTLTERPSVIALSKCDLLPDESERNELLSKFAETRKNVYLLSAITGEGIEKFLYALLDILRKHPRTYESPQEIVLKPKSQEEIWEIEKIGNAFRVKGEKVERIVAMTPLDNTEALERLHRTLTKMGVIEALKKAGAKEMDTVLIGKAEFHFTEDE